MNKKPSPVTSDGPIPNPKKNKKVRPIKVDQPATGPARIKRRHLGLLLSMVMVIAVPTLLMTVYLVSFAQPQYASTVGFTVREEANGNATDLMGNLSGLLGSPVQGNADLLFEYVQSQEIVERVSAEFDLIEHYSAHWPRDPLFAIWPSAKIEDLHWFWNRMTRIIYDQSTGLISVEVRAGDAATAQQLARLIVAESEEMINGLNESARASSMRYAEIDLNDAISRLKLAREALAEFRGRTQILDPLADIQGRMGVLTVLQQQLAEALVDFDLLAGQSGNNGDPRVEQLQRRIDVVRNRISEERRLFTQQDVTVDDTDYPSLLAQYESLLVDQTFAEATYQAALISFDAARSSADRQTLYLARFIRPSLAQRAQYPQSVLIVFLTVVFASLAWSIMALVYYSLRDRG